MSGDYSRKVKESSVMESTIARDSILHPYHGSSDHHSESLFQTDIQVMIQNTIRSIAAELNYQGGERELALLTQFYVGALVSMVEDWLLE